MGGAEGVASRSYSELASPDRRGVRIFLSLFAIFPEQLGHSSPVILLSQLPNRELPGIGRFWHAEGSPSAS